MNDFNVVIGKNIRKLRENYGYTRETLAELADMNDKFLYEVETGKKGLSAQKMFKLSHSLGVTMDFLVSGEQIDNDLALLLSQLSYFNKTEIKCIEEIIRKIREISNSHPSE